MIIGISGQMAMGKDTVADYLANELNNVTKTRWYRGSLSSNVKRIFCDAFGVDLNFIEEWKRKDTPPPGFQMPIRQALTFIGDGFRNVRRSVWMDLLFNNSPSNLIISDCRYINEIQYVKENNGITILLWRPGHENHIDNRSEQELMEFVYQLRDVPDGILKDNNIPFDIWIRNDGTLDDLYGKIETIIIPYVERFKEKYGC